MFVNAELFKQKMIRENTDTSIGSSTIPVASSIDKDIISRKDIYLPMLALALRHRQKL